MINTIKEYSVQKNVAKVLRIKKLKNEDVYNMEVEKHHNFAVNNGHIVHNCMDCLRYICQELPYEYLDMSRVSNNNYLKFFENQVKDTRTGRALSFKEMIDIINTDAMVENTEASERYAGGYTI